MKKPIFGSGWKMFFKDQEAIAYAEVLKESIRSEKDVELFVLPSFTAIHRVSGILAGSDVNVGAQNMCWEDKGAFTGEVSVLSLKDMGIKYIEIGHSERRAMFGENHTTVNLKIKKALEHGLIPIFCIGEDEEEKEKNLTREFLAMEIKTALLGLDLEAAKKVVYAYEPVWAIGKDQAADAGYAEEIHKFIRGYLAGLYPESGDGAEFSIIYGGSVSAENAGELISKPDIDGIFVGRASLKIESYKEMLRLVKDAVYAEK